MHLGKPAVSKWTISKQSLWPHCLTWLHTQNFHSAHCGSKIQRTCVFPLPVRHWIKKPYQGPSASPGVCTTASWIVLLLGNYLNLSLTSSTLAYYLNTAAKPPWLSTLWLSLHCFCLQRGIWDIWEPLNKPLFQTRKFCVALSKSSRPIGENESPEGPLVWTDLSACCSKRLIAGFALRVKTHILTKKSPEMCFNLNLSKAWSTHSPC